MNPNPKLNQSDFEARRLLLDTKLRTICKNVYFQPPESVKMKYPCIVYHRATGDTQFANNIPYVRRPQYEVTMIDKDPDSPIIDNFWKTFPLARFSRHFTYDNLNHDSFALYF